MWGWCASAQRKPAASTGLRGRLQGPFLAPSRGDRLARVLAHKPGQANNLEQRSVDGPGQRVPPGMAGRAVSLGGRLTPQSQPEVSATRKPAGEGRPCGRLACGQPAAEALSFRAASSGQGPARQLAGRPGSSRAGIRRSAAGRHRQRARTAPGLGHIRLGVARAHWQAGAGPAGPRSQAARPAPKGGVCASESAPSRAGRASAAGGPRRAFSAPDCANRLEQCVRAPVNPDTAGGKALRRRRAAAQATAVPAVGDSL